LRLLKGRTARACNLELNRNGSFWQHESYDHLVRDEQEMERTILYILNNPVKAGLVKEWKDWPFTYVSPELGDW
jgi:REP element-mobilizing transposase RayT